MEIEIPQNNILEFKPKAELLAPGEEVSPFGQAYSIAVVSHVKDNIPVSVALNGNSYNVIGYLSVMPGIAPCVSLGDNVLVSALDEGVLIHGVVSPVDAPVRASFGFVEGKLVIEAQGAVMLKSGNTTIELTEAGSIRIDGKKIRTVAENELTLQGSNLNLN